MARKRYSEAMELLTKVSNDLLVHVEDIRSRSTVRRFAAARKEFCRRGRATGIPLETLAAAINRDPSTIAYHADPQVQKTKVESKRILRQARKEKLRKPEAHQYYARNYPL